VLPLSTTDKRGRYYYEFDGHTGKQSIALLSQPRTIDSARLRRKIGYISKTAFDELKMKLRSVIGL
jgi:mRNA-degrading endonuclease toxin of MazEF toxin-antitoxin module